MTATRDRWSKERLADHRERVLAQLAASEKPVSLRNLFYQMVSHLPDPRRGLKRGVV